MRCASKVCSAVAAKAVGPLPAGGERRGLRPPERAFLQPRRSAKASPVLSIVLYDVFDCTRPTEARIFREKAKRLSVNYVKLTLQHPRRLQSRMCITIGSSRRLSDPRRRVSVSVTQASAPACVTMTTRTPPLLLSPRWIMLSMDTPASRVAAAISASRSEEHTSELQSLMRISYAVFCLKKKNHLNT